MNLKISHYDRQISKSDELKIAIAIETLLQHKKVVCVACLSNLSKNPNINLYDHPGGVFLIKTLPTQWLSIHCPSCNHDTSYSKLPTVLKERK